MSSPNTPIVPCKCPLDNQATTSSHCPICHAPLPQPSLTRALSWPTPLPVLAVYRRTTAVADRVRQGLAGLLGSSAYATPSDSDEDADGEDAWTDCSSDAGSQADAQDWEVTGEASCRYAAATSFTKKRKAGDEVVEEAPVTPKRSPRIVALKLKKIEVAKVEAGPSTPKHAKEVKKPVTPKKAAASKQPFTPKKAGIVKNTTLEIPATPTTPRRSPRLAAKAASAAASASSTPKTSPSQPSTPCAPAKARRTRKASIPTTKPTASKPTKRTKTTATPKSPSPAPKLVKKETRFLVTVASSIAPKSPLLERLAPLSPILPGRTRAEQRELEPEAEAAKKGKGKGKGRAKEVYPGKGKAIGKGKNVEKVKEVGSGKGKGKA
ncbi:hypothetical protein B0A48_17413 [Cryoendolithus antarcticus]|uniref:Uncharacterized protein n=1 Tax=Cryoendolithus antarcticus TaxID=1507870 RepID=A0A1V8SCS4_9PEZI|nr:hypothetical protein B0A48_17413 [Cryoendolithus antarcticus]